MVDIKGAPEGAKGTDLTPEAVAAALAQATMDDLMGVTDAARDQGAAAIAAALAAQSSHDAPVGGQQVDLAALRADATADDLLGKIGQ